MSNAEDRAGTVVIHGGTATADSGSDEAEGGNVTICGGRITATGRNHGAGIGSGHGAGAARSAPSSVTLQLMGFVLRLCKLKMDKDGVTRVEMRTRTLKIAERRKKPKQSKMKCTPIVVLSKLKCFHTAERLF